MKIQFRAPVAVAIAMGVGIIVLLGYFFGTNAEGQLNILGILRDYFLQGAVVVAGVALLVGVFNLASTHAKKIQQKDGAIYSTITIVALVITLLIGTYDLVMTYWQGVPGLKWTRWLFENVQLPIEASLMAVLVVSLTFAATRLLSRRLSFMSAIFIFFVFLLLLTAIPAVSSRVEFLAGIRGWILGVPAVGGARGILLGVALGVIATGLRVLLGTDRPYGG